MKDLNVLVGKTLKFVEKIKWDGKRDLGPYAYGGVFKQNADLIVFHCENGDYVFLADGDCCSRTYIDSISGPQKGKIINVDEPFLPHQTAGEDEPVMKFYSAKLTIEGKGYLDIEYRNESNGYYGGRLSYVSGPEKEDD